MNRIFSTRSRKSAAGQCPDMQLLNSSSALLRAAMLAAVTFAVPATAQLVIESDVETSLEAEADANPTVVPLSATAGAKMSAQEEATLGAQVNNATSAVVNSGAAGKAAMEKESKNMDVMQIGAEAETYSEAVSRERMEANAEAKARTKLDALGVDADGEPTPRTQLEKRLRADRNATRPTTEPPAATGPGAASASAASRIDSSRRNSNVSEATANEPVVGTYEAIDVDSEIESDVRNGGQQLSKEARSGVQLILPGTGVNSGDKKAARVESAAEARASNRFLKRQEPGASPETYAAVDEVFAKVDADGDNELSPEERINASNEVRLSAVYKLADTNRDGMVSRAELTVAMEANAGR